MKEVINLSNKIPIYCCRVKYDNNKPINQFVNRDNCKSKNAMLLLKNIFVIS